MRQRLIKISASIAIALTLYFVALIPPNYFGASTEMRDAVSTVALVLGVICGPDVADRWLNRKRGER